MTTTSAATPQQMSAKLADKQVYNDRYTQYHFELVSPHKINNQAGQYVMIKVAHDPQTMRAYSMCDRPDIDSSFDILVDHKPDGVGVNFLRQLAFGQEIELLGPLGQLVVPPDSLTNDLVLIATGSGISPFKAIITDQLQLQRSPRQITLIWGMTNDQEFFWLEDLLAIQDSFPNFDFLPVVFEPTPAWKLATGLATDILKSMDFKEDTYFYHCGNQTMIADCRTILTNKNVPADKIITEGF